MMNRLNVSIKYSCAKFDNNYVSLKNYILISSIFLRANAYYSLANSNSTFYQSWKNIKGFFVLSIGPPWDDIVLRRH